MNRRLSFILAFGLTAALCVLGSAQAAIIYVNRDNSCPGDGSSGTPYCSIQNAFNAVKPGDNIRIRKASTPYDQSASVAVSGTATAPITLEADDPANPPIIRYTGNGSQTAAIRLANVDYWTIQNLVFDGTGIWTSSMAVWVQGDNWFRGINRDQVGIQILNNIFKNWGGTEAQINSVWPNGAKALNIGGGWGPPTNANLPNGTVIRGNIFDGNRHISIEMTSTKNSIVENNEFKNLTCGIQNDGAGGKAVVTNGIHTISGTTGVGTGDLYRRNTFHDFQSPTLCGLTQTSGAYTEMSAIHVDVGPANGVIDENTVWNLDPANSKPQVIALFVEQDDYGWIVKNNVIHDVGLMGIRHNPSTIGPVSQYLNNTIYNIKGYGIQLWSGNAVVKNNIFANAGIAQIQVTPNAVSQGNLTINYNDYWDNAGGTKVGLWNATGGTAVNFSTWKASCRCDANSLNADPLFVNPPSDFHLQPSSPALGAGEGGVDMGAYTTIAPSPPTNLRVIQILP